MALEGLANAIKVGGRASVGDLVVIAAFGMVHQDRLGQTEPKLVFPDAANRIVEIHSEPAGRQVGEPHIHPLGAEL